MAREWEEKADVLTRAAEGAADGRVQAEADALDARARAMWAAVATGAVTDPRDAMALLDVLARDGGLRDRDPGDAAVLAHAALLRFLAGLRGDNLQIVPIKALAKTG